MPGSGFTLRIMSSAEQGLSGSKVHRKEQSFRLVSEIQVNQHPSSSSQQSEYFTSGLCLYCESSFFGEGPDPTYVC